MTYSLTTSPSDATPSVYTEFHAQWNMLNNCILTLNALYPQHIEDSVQIQSIREQILEHQQYLIDPNVISTVTLEGSIKASDLSTHLQQLTLSMEMKIVKQEQASDTPTHANIETPV